MPKDYRDITQSISHSLGTLRKERPELMEAFSKLSKAALATGPVLDEKTKEYVALGIAVSSRCEGCIGFHVRNLLKLGATSQEIYDVLGVAVYMGGGPTLMYAAEAITALEQFAKIEQPTS